MGRWLKVWKLGAFINMFGYIICMITIGGSGWSSNQVVKKMVAWPLGWGHKFRCRIRREWWEAENRGPLKMSWASRFQIILFAKWQIDANNKHHRATHHFNHKMPISYITLFSFTFFTYPPSLILLFIYISNFINFFYLGLWNPKELVNFIQLDRSYYM